MWLAQAREIVYHGSAVPPLQLHRLQQAASRRSSLSQSSVSSHTAEDFPSAGARDTRDARGSHVRPSIGAGRVPSADDMRATSQRPAAAPPGDMVPRLALPQLETPTAKRAERMQLSAAELAFMRVWLNVARARRSELSATRARVKELARRRRRGAPDSPMHRHTSDEEQ